MDEETALSRTRFWFRQLAHDVRQPLSTIDSTAYLLRLTNGDSQDQFNRIQELIQQASQLITDAASLIDPAGCELEPIALAGVVEKRLKVRLPSEQDRVVFEAGIQPTVLADRVLLPRLVDCFLSLGLSATEDREPLTLRLVAPATLAWSIRCPSLDSRALSVAALRNLCQLQEARFVSAPDSDSKLLLKIELRRM